MMEREVGNRNFPLWLIGDSNPPQWQSSLKTPLDPRHPVRHNIWTSLLDVIQDKVYRVARMRIDTSNIYIRNAVDDPAKKPTRSSNQWNMPTKSEIAILGGLIENHKPVMLFCFGAFTFEFSRRAIGEQERRNYGYWDTRRLGDAFRNRTGNFDPNKTNIIPLLHRSISGGKFIKSHEYFCGEEGANYFEVVGGKIADKMLQYRDQLHIWIE